MGGGVLSLLLTLGGWEEGELSQSDPPPSQSTLPVCPQDGADRGQDLGLTRVKACTLVPPLVRSASRGGNKVRGNCSWILIPPLCHPGQPRESLAVGLVTETSYPVPA